MRCARAGVAESAYSVLLGWARNSRARNRPWENGILLPMRSSIPHPSVVHITAERRCLVCDFTEEVRELETTDAIGPPCSQCHAPSERIRILARHLAAPNPHAAALGRLGGLKGGPARAAALSARRRREIARAAARARWSRPRD